MFTLPSRLLQLAALVLLHSLTGCGGGGGSGEGSGGGDGTGGGEAPMFMAPVTGTVQCSRGFGYDASRSENHLGIDFSVGVGTGVYASRGGRVLRASAHQTFGNMVILEHTGVDASFPYYYTLYLHLSAFHVALWDNVDRGQLIASSGATGVVTGPHLHFGIVRSTVPMPWATTGNDDLPTGGRVDPYSILPGLDSSCGPIGGGGTPPPPSPAGPGEFRMLTSGISRAAGSEVRDQYITWDESAGATSYQIVLFYFSELYYIPPGGTESLTTGFSTYSAQLPATARRYDWSTDWSQQANGTYYWKVLARNAAGTRLTTAAHGTVDEVD